MSKSACRGAARYKAVRPPGCNGGDPCESCVRRWEGKPGKPFAFLDRRSNEWVLMERYDTLVEAEVAVRRSPGAWKWYGPWAAARVLLAGGTGEKAEKAVDRSDEIDRILEKLGRHWRAHPDLRLGQILYEVVSAFREAVDTEDNEVETALDEELKR